MMIAVTIPSPGESITEVELAEWLVSNGDYVEKDQEIAEIESEKATLPLIAEDSGKIEILVEEGTTLNVGDVACNIDTEQKGKEKTAEKEAASGPEKEEKQGEGSQPAKEKKKTEEKSPAGSLRRKEEVTGPEEGKKQEKPSSPSPSEKKGKDSETGEKNAEDPGAEKEKQEKTGGAGEQLNTETDSAEEKAFKEREGSNKEQEKSTDKVKVTPVAKNIIDANNLSVDDIIAGLRKISKKEVEAVLQFRRENGDGQYSQQSGESAKEGAKGSAGGIGRESAGDARESAKDSAGKPFREASRKKMTSLRRKLSQRLVSVKNETAMLTTFNEVNMKPLMDLRKKHQKRFMEKHGIKLGFMSFFTKAASLALELFPQVNSIMDEEEMVTFHYADIGIAVQTEKGLMVPVIRNTEIMGLAELEKSISEMAEKARKFRISMDEMSGGTFSITNGGIFGSMLSTPILNPPQAAILGMHNIVERPVAIEGKVEVRPIMYLALTYDHRLIDGKDSVQFLYTIKDLIENPYKMLLKGTDPEKALLEL